MLDYEQAKLFYRKALELADNKEVGDIQFSLAEVYEANDELDAAIAAYLKLAKDNSDNRQLLIRALLRVARIYEDKDDFKSASGIYERVVQNKCEESKFAQERIDWIKLNIK
jgi:tetratricopeptide (TPR) repeat protein